MMSTKKPEGPVLIELDAISPETPATAPPVPETQAALPQGQAMQSLAKLAARRPSRIVRWFWGLLVSITGFVVSVAAWDFVNNLIARSPILGYAAVALISAFMLVLLILALREWVAFARLRRVDAIHNGAEVAMAQDDLGAARSIVAQIKRLYRGRDELRWGMERLNEREAEQIEAAALFNLAEVEVLSHLDGAATREVEAAARQVATVTAIVPIALADVGVALTANLRMIRRIAEIYGGRSGTFGSWRLVRAVMTHLVATGAVAVGDDLIGSLAGGGVLSKLSRRFGEGVVNGALTARVGVAAMEVCRPLPFHGRKRPRVTVIIKRALTGLFSST